MKLRKRAGFSLAEVLVAVALLSVILLALFGLVSAGVRQAYSGKKMTQGTIIAQSAMERMNVQKPQDLLGGIDTDTSQTRTWTKVSPSTADSYTTPAAETGTSAPVVARNAVRALLRDSDLSASTANPATLTVTMTAQPAGKNFGNASMIRIVVDLQWSDFGRPRKIRLQMLNMRVVSS